MPEIKDTRIDIRIPHNVLRGQVSQLLAEWGIGADDSDLIVDAIVETKLRAIDAHDISMLAHYDQMRRDGGLDVCPAARLREHGIGPDIVGRLLLADPKLESGRSPRHRPSVRSDRPQGIPRICRVRG